MTKETIYSRLNRSQIWKQSQDNTQYRWAFYLSLSILIHGHVEIHRDDRYHFELLMVILGVGCDRHCIFTPAGNEHYQVRLNVRGNKKRILERFGELPVVGVVQWEEGGKPVEGWVMALVPAGVEAAYVVRHVLSKPMPGLELGPARDHDSIVVLPTGEAQIHWPPVNKLKSITQ